jgi:hypothetical protein
LQTRLTALSHRFPYGFQTPLKGSFSHGFNDAASQHIAKRISGQRCKVDLSADGATDH